MFGEQTITIRLNTAILVAGVLAALTLGAIGFAAGVLVQRSPAGGDLRSSIRPEETGSGSVAIVGGDPETLYWFLQMDRAFDVQPFSPGVIQADGSTLSSWFPQMDHAFDLNPRGPAVILTNDPSELNWFLEMDRAFDLP